jgi:hypothetical protein
MLTPNQMNKDHCNAMQGGLALSCLLFQMEEEPHADTWLCCLLLAV